MLKTPICERLGIEYPIFQAGMGCFDVVEDFAYTFSFKTAFPEMWKKTVESSGESNLGHNGDQRESWVCTSGLSQFRKKYRKLAFTHTPDTNKMAPV